MDKISIIIPTHNREAVLPRAVASVLAQTFTDWELIIIDDGSTDGTHDFLHHLAAQDSRVKTVHHPDNLGAAQARNAGLQIAEGKYIAFLDSDDEWLPEKLNIQYTFLEQNRHMAACCTGFAIQRGQALPDFRFTPQLSYWRNYLLQGSTISPGTTLMVRRVCFDQIGGFAPQLRRLEDWEWLLRFITRYQLDSVPDILATVYRGPKPSTASVKEAVSQFKKILPQHHGLTQDEKYSIKAVLNLEVAASAWTHGHYLSAVLRVGLQSLIKPQVSMQYLQRWLARRSAPKIASEIPEEPVQDLNHLAEAAPRGLNTYDATQANDGSMQRAFTYLMHYQERQALIGRAHALCSQLSRLPVQSHPVDWQGRPVYLQSDLELPFQAPMNLPIPEAISGWQAKTERPLAVVNVDKPETDIHLEVMRLPLDRYPLAFAAAGPFIQNEIWYQTALSALSQQRVSFVYQQYQWGHYAGLQLARALAKPLILEYSGNLAVPELMAARYQTLAHRIQDLNLQQADLLVVPNQQVFNQLREWGISEHRILLNPPGVDEKIYYPELASQELRQRLHLENLFVIGILGTPQSNSAMVQLAEALKTLSLEHSDIHYLWFGKSQSLSHSTLNDFISELPGRVSFQNIDAAQSLPEFLSVCDLFIVPEVDSMKEPGSAEVWPTWAELMALGKAVVCCARANHFLDSGETALLISTAEANAWQQALEAVYQDSALRQKLGQQATDIAKRLYSWQAHGERLNARLLTMNAEPAPNIHH